MLTFQVITNKEIKPPESGDIILTTKGWKQINKVTSEIYEAVNYGIIMGSPDHIVTGINGKSPLGKIKRKLLRHRTSPTFPILQKGLAEFLGIRCPSIKEFEIEHIDFDMACTMLSKYSTKLSNYKNTVLHFAEHDDRNFIVSALIAGYSIRPFNKFNHCGKRKISTSPLLSCEVVPMGKEVSIGYEIDVEDYFMCYKERMFIA